MIGREYRAVAELPDRARTPVSVAVYHDPVRRLWGAYVVLDAIERGPWRVARGDRRAGGGTVTADPCPVCKGRCCRDYYLYRVVHMGAEHYQHDCDACEDGTKYVPPRDPASGRGATGPVAWALTGDAATRRAVSDYYMASIQIKLPWGGAE